MILATLANFNGLSDLCNAYDTLGSRNFVQIAVIRSLDIQYADYMNDFLKKNILMSLICSPNFQFTFS